MTRTLTRHDALNAAAWKLLRAVSDRFHTGGSFSPEVAAIDALLRKKALADGKQAPPERSVRARAAFSGKAAKENR